MNVPIRYGLALLLVSLSALGVIAAGHGSAASPVLASHRAIYALKLLRAKPDSAVTSASGRLVIEWQDTCEGFTTNQRFLTDFGNNDGQDTITDLWVSSFESRDGALFRFNLTDAANGVVQQRSRGTAHRSTANGGPGDIAYDEPKPQHRALPAGTIFPSEHTTTLIEAAKTGVHTLERTVFDGGVDNGISYVSAFIGNEIQAKPAPDLASDKGTASLTEGRGWPVRIAFYPHDKGDDMPDYEMSYVMHENGVATGIQFDYGDFVVAAELTKIEPLPGCEAKKPEKGLLR
jgi:hypothetical protein